MIAAPASAGTVTTDAHLGHLPCLPASFSLTFSVVLHDGQRTAKGIDFVSRKEEIDVLNRTQMRLVGLAGLQFATYFTLVSHGSQIMLF